jgi:hypothetical protein
LLIQKRKVTYDEEQGTTVIVCQKRLIILWSSVQVTHALPFILKQPAVRWNCGLFFCDRRGTGYLEPSPMQVPTIIPSTAETMNQVVRKIAMVIYGYVCLPVISRCASVALERSVFDTRLKQILVQFTGVRVGNYAL